MGKDYFLKPYDYVIMVKELEDVKYGVLLNTITKQGKNVKIIVKIINDQVVRIRAFLENEYADLEDKFWLEKLNLKENNYNIKIFNDQLSIFTTSIEIRIKFDPWNLAFYNRKGQIILSETATDVNAIGKDRSLPLGYSYESGQILGFNETFILRYDEHFYGFGEKFIDFDKRSERLIMWNKDALGVRNEASYKNIPFFMSTKGYGIFVNSAKAVEFNMGSISTASYTMSLPGNEMDYYVIYGPAFKNILYHFTELTGKASLPPLWSFGLWLSTGFKETDRNQVEELSKKIRKEDIPADIIHFDCYWLRNNMWCDLTWDKDRFYKPQELISNLNKQGYKICLWINPYVSEKSQMFMEGVSKGYFLKKKDGDVYIKDMWHGQQPPCAIIDFSNPEAVDWFKNKLVDLLNIGISVFKTDFGEDIPPDAYFYNGKTGKEMHNLYSLYYNRIVFSVTKEVSGYGLVWGRSGYIGSQKYPVCWSGDPATSFEAMASVLRGGLSYGMSGVPFWSHDIGGFYGTPTKELYIRWAQFGFFTSHTRCHGITTREPWNYGEEAKEIFKKYSKLRYRLLPYIYSSAIKSIKIGLPFIRPLVLEHQNDPTTYNIDDQYYFGDDILVAPLFSEENFRKIYLPKGNWIDYWNGKIYCGPQWINYNAPLDTLPLFIKKGAIIPLLVYDLNFVKDKITEDMLFLEVYSEEDTDSIVYLNKDVILNIRVKNNILQINNKENHSIQWNIKKESS